MLKDDVGDGLASVLNNDSKDNVLCVCLEYRSWVSEYMIKTYEDKLLLVMGIELNEALGVFPGSGESMLNVSLWENTSVTSVTLTNSKK
jgi:hypothetical protein